MSRAKVHSAGRLQSVGRGIASPYSTEGYWRNARCAKTALKTAPAIDTDARIFQKLVIEPVRCSNRKLMPAAPGQAFLFDASTSPCNIGNRKLGRLDAFSG